MKPLIFEVPAVQGESLVVQEDKLPYFYNVFHKHEQIQITAIIEGDGDLTTKNGHTKFLSNEMYIIGRNHPHMFKSGEEYFQKNEKNRAHAIHIYFKSELILDNFNLPEFEEVKRFVNRIGSGLKIDGHKASLFIEQIKKISTAKGMKRIFLLVELLRTCYFNLENFTYLNTSEKVSENFYYNNKTRINDIYTYTLAHFTENINLKNVARVANMTVPAMCKYFKKSTRKTYMDFLKDVRIDYACKKIVRGDYSSIAEIAYSVGFKSAITFNRAFKSKTGKTPTEYLHEHQHYIEEAKKTVGVEEYFSFH